MIERWFEYQDQPRRFLIYLNPYQKDCKTGITIWKWSGSYVPMVCFCFYGYEYHLAFDNVYHWGRGIHLRLGGFVFDWCYTGMFGYWEQDKKIRIYFRKKEHYYA